MSAGADEELAALLQSTVPWTLANFDGNSEEDFVPAVSFSGARCHFVFKMGDRGLGYYRDGAPLGGIGEASSPATAEGSFLPSASFAGARDGFVFKLGGNGLGYYRDENLWADGDFVAAASFAGARGGFVFKMGEHGLGYYRDRGLVASPPAAGERRARRAEADSAAQARARGFRFGGGSSERAFRAFCEAAVQGGKLSTDEVGAMYAAVERCAEPDQSAAMVSYMESGLRGEEVRRTPRQPPCEPRASASPARAPNGRPMSLGSCRGCVTERGAPAVDA